MEINMIVHACDDGVHACMWDGTSAGLAAGQVTTVLWTRNSGKDYWT